MSACFLVNGIIFGIINTFGILFVELKKEMVANGVEDASAKCSLVGSLTIGTTFFLSFLVGILSDKIGLRATAVLGSCLATTGMGLSALVGYKQVFLFSFDSIWQNLTKIEKGGDSVPHVWHHVWGGSQLGVHALPHHPRPLLQEEDGDRQRDRHCWQLHLHHWAQFCQPVHSGAPRP